MHRSTLIYPCLDCPWPMGGRTGGSVMLALESRGASIRIPGEDCTKLAEPKRPPSPPIHTCPCPNVTTARTCPSPVGISNILHRLTVVRPPVIQAWCRSRALLVLFVMPLLVLLITLWGCCRVRVIYMIIYENGRFRITKIPKYLLPPSRPSPSFLPPPRTSSSLLLLSHPPHPYLLFALFYAVHAQKWGPVRHWRRRLVGVDS